MHYAINWLVEHSLKGRFMTLIITGVIVALGVLAWKKLPLEAYPELSNPQVRIITLYPGKGGEEVEKLVTIPMEKELLGIPRQIRLRSLSLYGLSVVTTTFSDGTPVSLARQQVLERLTRVELPPDANPQLEPEVGSLREIYRYALHSRYFTPMELRSFQQWELERLFRQIPGVIGVISQGGPTKSYLIQIDPHKLRAYDITLQEVFNAVSHANATSGGGFLERNGQALIIREMGLLKGVGDIEEIVVKAHGDGIPIRIRDVANVSIEPLVRRGQVGHDHEDDVVEGIVLLRRDENPSQVLAELKQRLPGILKKLPPGVTFETLYDRSTLVDRTVKTVSHNVFTGIALVFIFLCLFLVDIVPAVITAIVIPVSVLISFIGLNIFGVPANLLSLGAIDFGILVDSAVVMTENIVRFFSEAGPNKTPLQRLQILRESACEVAAPLVSGIIVIIATFLPIFAFTGVEGKLFRPLATTMVTALVGAGLCALTLVPVLCSFWFPYHPPREKESFIVLLARKIYAPTLHFALRLRWLVILLAIAAFVAIVPIYTSMGSEFLPHLEEGNIWLRGTIKPGSVTLAEANHICSQIREKILKFPEVTGVLSQAGGPDDGSDPNRFADLEFFIGLKPFAEWPKEMHEDKEKLIEMMKEDLEEIPNVKYYFTQYIQTTLDEALSGVQGSLVAKVSGPDLETLEQTAIKVGALMRTTPGIVDVIVDPLMGQPQLKIEIDRVAAARYGLTVDDLKDLVEIELGGKTATVAIEEERRYNVIVRLAEAYRNTSEDLEKILVDTPSGVKIPLSQIAKVKETMGATQIWREGGSRLATIRANVRGRDLATAVAEAQAKVDKMELPTGYSVIWSGEFERQKEASNQLMIVLPITLGVIFVILYFACGSLSGAMVVFSVIPLAAIGGVLSLYVTKTYFSISAGVGFIALFGLAVKNGILLVSFVDELRMNGVPIRTAVYKGAITRMRPVLMTAAIAAVGLLPAALSNEIGAQTQKPFAIVIIGGMIFCTFLTLYVLPCIYLYFRPSSGKMKQVESDMELSSQTAEALPLYAFPEKPPEEAETESSNKDQ
ncbi:MAG: CusA/CzcA family heavy metal efflux RND transporter [Candidatus Melainabacteria bacterium]|nr:CusA/CzcA family heavy metal efflux RND transporter [Candidatus Melainabacteria bacterium]